MYWGVGRECRYSGARRGYRWHKGHWGTLWGCRGTLGGVGGARVYWGWQGVQVLGGQKGYRWYKGH